ncbi:YetF domain-containing protein [Bacillus dakarensis]|uniref:YetF domain-containing protein n=1 Tax=Robertmurraya dakarensis TaxID=1926278 RepID=UPI00098109B2|nr:DUF421 domain-containing protein [Bacillus dakarensis]
MGTGELLMRITIAFFVLFVLARIMGRKEISQMTFFNWVSAISIGSITANLAVNQNLSIQNGVLALVGWSIFTIFMGIIDIKSKVARKITTGQPEMVIKEGKIMEGALRRLRMDVDELSAMLRQKNVFAMSDVDYAILETSGRLSVMKKEEKQALTKSDANIFYQQPKKFKMATQVISDGKVITQNLSKLHLDSSWLEKQLEKAGVYSVTDVFFAEVQPDGSLYIDNKNDIH